MVENAGKRGRPARLTLKSIAGYSVLCASAKRVGEWGNHVRLEVDHNTASPNAAFNMRVIHAPRSRQATEELYTELSMKPASPRFAPAFVTQQSELVDLVLDPSMGNPSDQKSFINRLEHSFAGWSQARRPLGRTAPEVWRALTEGLINAPGQQCQFDICVDDSSFVTVDLSQGADFPVPEHDGDYAHMADTIGTKINQALDTLSLNLRIVCELVDVRNLGRQLKITSATVESGSVAVRRAASRDITTALMLGVEQGGMEATRWSIFHPAANGTLLRLGKISPPESAPAGNLQRFDELSGLPQDAVLAITVDGTTVALDTAPFSLQTGGERWYRNALGKSPVTNDCDGMREKLGIIAQAISAEPRLNHRAEVWRHYLVVTPTEGSINAQAKVRTGLAAFDEGILENVRQYTLGLGGKGPFTHNEPDDDGVDSSGSPQPDAQ